MAQMADLIARLAERTTEGRIPWKATADESTFAATFGDMSLLISERQMVSHGSTAYKLSVLDEKGYEIESALYIPGIEGQNSQLEEIYLSAKRQALGIEERLQDLMTRIG